MAPYLQTIKNRSIFLQVRDHGELLRGKALDIQFLKDKNLDKIIAVGYTATKKLGSSVKRNKAKRLMRELAKKVLIKYGKTNSYYVLVAKNSIFQTSLKMLEIELKKLIS